MNITETSVLKFRVLPNDLDLNVHMNNGRYLSIMDLGRVDIMHRTGLGKYILENKWAPIVGHAHMRYRRPLKPFQSYELHSRIICWDDKWFYIEQRFESAGKLIAIGLVQGLIRGKEGNLSTNYLTGLLGFEQPSPTPSKDVQLLQQYEPVE